MYREYNPLSGFTPTRDSDLAWLAGLLEGEGSFQGLREKNGRTRLRITLTMTDLDVCERAQEVAGGSVHGPYQPAGNRKPVWRWHINARDNALAVMLALRPLMCSRRQGQIDAAITVASAARPPRYSPKKLCRHCGKMFKKGTRGQEAWERAAACSLVCSGALRKGKPRGYRPEPMPVLD